VSSLIDAAATLADCQDGEALASLMQAGLLLPRWRYGEGEGWEVEEWEWREGGSRIRPNEEDEEEGEADGEEEEEDVFRERTGPRERMLRAGWAALTGALILGRVAGLYWRRQGGSEGMDEPLRVLLERRVDLYHRVRGQSSTR
jgi:hypothetical protein